jgi:hypothetical protein
VSDEALDFPQDQPDGGLHLAQGLIDARTADGSLVKGYAA